MDTAKTGIAIVMTAMLAGCGGGAGGTDASGGTASSTAQAGINAAAGTSSNLSASDDSANPSVSGSDYAQGSFQLEFFDKLNLLREELGLQALTQSSSLDAAAQAHALYLSVNYEPQTMSGTDPSTGLLYAHSEDAGSPDFYAALPQTRDQKAGFTGALTAEVEGPTYGGTTYDGDEGLRELLNTVYHRESLLADAYQSIGIGADAASNAYESYGHYVSDLGGEDAGRTLPAGTLLVYPQEGAADAEPYFANSLEAPAPVPNLGSQALGGPISVQVPWGDTLTVHSFTLADADGNAVPVVLRDSHTDTSGELQGNYAFIIPTAPLTPGATYMASFVGTDGNLPVSENWAFTTRGSISVLTAAPYAIHNGGSLLIQTQVPSGILSATWSWTGGNLAQMTEAAYGSEGMLFTVPAGTVTSPTSFSLTLSDARFNSVPPVTISVLVSP